MKKILITGGGTGTAFSYVTHIKKIGEIMLKSMFVILMSQNISHQHYFLIMHIRYLTQMMRTTKSQLLIS